MVKSEPNIYEVVNEHIGCYVKLILRTGSIYSGYLTRKGANYVTLTSLVIHREQGGKVNSKGKSTRSFHIGTIQEIVGA